MSFNQNIYVIFNFFLRMDPPNFFSLMIKVITSQGHIFKFAKILKLVGTP